MLHYTNRSTQVTDIRAVTLCPIHTLTRFIYSQSRRCIVREKDVGIITFRGIQQAKRGAQLKLIHWRLGRLLRYTPQTKSLAARETLHAKRSIYG